TAREIDGGVCVACDRISRLAAPEAAKSPAPGAAREAIRVRRHGVSKTGKGICCPTAAEAAASSATAAASGGIRRLAENDVGIRRRAVMGDFQLAGDAGALDREERFLDPLIRPFFLLVRRYFQGVGEDGICGRTGIDINIPRSEDFFAVAPAGG